MMSPVVHRLAFKRRDTTDPSFLVFVLIAVFAADSARNHFTEAVKIDVTCSCTKSRNRVVKMPATCKNERQNKTTCCKKAYPSMDCKFAAKKKGPGLKPVLGNSSPKSSIRIPGEIEVISSRVTCNLVEGLTFLVASQSIYLFGLLGLIACVCCLCLFFLPLCLISSSSSCM